MRLEPMLKELRLMRAQPGHRYYAQVVIVALWMFRRPISAALVFVLIHWLKKFLAGG